jgi:hypothetical protein
MEPEIPELGRLELCEVYVYYDGPLIFACRSRAGQLFFALLIADDGSLARWLYAAVDAARLKAIERNQISLRDAFLDAEEVLAVSLDQDNHWSAERLTLSSVPDEWLPTEGEFLDLREPVR